MILQQFVETYAKQELNETVVIYEIKPVKILEDERVLIQTTHSTVHVISTIKVLVMVNVIELDLLS
jgi:predicted transcriptional regulator